MQVLSLGWEDALEKEVATHSNILASESHGQKRQAIVHGVTKSLTRLSAHTHTHTHTHTQGQAEHLQASRRKIKMKNILIKYIKT